MWNNVSMPTSHSGPKSPFCPHRGLEREIVAQHISYNLNSLIYIFLIEKEKMILIIIFMIFNKDKMIIIMIFYISLINNLEK